MVVDGSIEFVGSSAQSANEAFVQALGAPRFPYVFLPSL